MFNIIVKHYAMNGIETGLSHAHFWSLKFDAYFNMNDEKCGSLNNNYNSRYPRDLSAGKRLTTIYQKLWVIS